MILLRACCLELFLTYVQEKYYNEVARDLRLDIYFKEKEIIISEKGLADCLEVILGTFYLNNGYKKTKNMIFRLWKTKLNKVNSIKVDSKTLLQEWSQSMKLGLPKYSIFDKNRSRSCSNFYYQG